jgi:trans-2-enoyl-CoA reductase
MSASELRTAIIVEHESLMTKYGHWTAVLTVFELDMFCLYDELREKELEKCTIKQLRREKLEQENRICRQLQQTLRRQIKEIKQQIQKVRRKRNGMERRRNVQGKRRRI